MFAQSNKYKIDVTLKGFSNTTAILAVHGGETKYAVDSVVLDQNGKGSFSKPRDLEGGMYFLAVDGAALFDFLVSADGSEFFEIIADKANDFSKIEFVNSPENTVWMTYLEYCTQHQAKSGQLVQKYSESPENSDEQKELRKQLLSFNSPLIEYSDSLAKQYKGKVLATIVKALSPREEPDLFLPEDEPDRERKMAINYYLFNKEHFFDNIDFSDERLLRTPFFMPLIFDYYFKNVIIFREADTIISCIDNVMNRIPEGSKMYRFLLSHLFNFYQRSTVMGHEAIPIHLGENYYLTPKVTWETEKFEKDLVDFILKNKPTLIGNISPDLMLPTLDGKRYESIHRLTANYIVLFFYDIDCGHCKEEVPHVKEIYDKYKNELELEVYAVYTMTNEQKWRDFIEQHKLDWINVWDPNRTADIYNTFNTVTTPQIYVLDKDKKVIARRLDTANLDKLLQLILAENK